MIQVFTLQQMTTLTESVPQSAEFALDILPYCTVSVQAARVGAGSGNKVYLQHAPVLDAAAFEDIDTNAWWDLASGQNTNETKIYTNLLRYLRWRGVYGSGSPMFELVVTARQGGPAVSV